MGGAPIILTLYKNGIHLSHGKPSFISAPALEEEMRRSFDAHEDDWALASRLIDERGLVKLISVAIDTYECIDKRGEVYPHTPVAFPSS